MAEKIRKKIVSLSPQSRKSSRVNFQNKNKMPIPPEWTVRRESALPGRQKYTHGVQVFLGTCTILWRVNFQRRINHEKHERTRKKDNIMFSGTNFLSSWKYTLEDLRPLFLPQIFFLWYYYAGSLRARYISYSLFFPILSAVFWILTPQGFLFSEELFTPTQSWRHQWWK